MDFISAALSSDEVWAMTKAPNALAICSACNPSPPPAPVTSTLSPTCTLPTSRTALRMVPIAQAAIATSARGTPSGTCATLSSSIATYSA